MMQKCCMFKEGYKQIHVVARQVKEYQHLCIFVGEAKLVRHPRKFPVFKFHLQIPQSHQIHWSLQPWLMAFVV